MHDLWEKGSCDLDGEFFKMTDCELNPQPSGPIEIVAAGQSGVGMDFDAEYADYSFRMGEAVNTPAKFAPSVGRLVAAARRTGRDVGPMRCSW
jgi:pyrimidine oxygenase